MPFAALIYVETLTNSGMARETNPRDASYILGSAAGSSPTRDDAARGWHRRLNLAPNQRVVFEQTDPAILKRIRTATEKAKAKGKDLSWLDAYLLVKSRLRGRNGRQRANST